MTMFIVRRTIQSLISFVFFNDFYEYHEMRKKVFYILLARSLILCPLCQHLFFIRTQLSGSNLNRNIIKMIRIAVHRIAVIIPSLFSSRYYVRKVSTIFVILDLELL